MLQELLIEPRKKVTECTHCEAVLFFLFAFSPSLFLSPRFFSSLFAFLLFCPTTPLQFSEKRHRPTFTLHQQRGLFPTTDSYRVQRRREKFAGFYLSNFWHFCFSFESASGLRVFFFVLRLSTCVVDPDHYTSP